MALTVQEQARYWGIGAVIVLVMFYFLGSVLTPFLVGAGLAYCLDPLADRLEALGASRIAATVIIMLSALMAFLVVVVVFVPFLVNQAQALAAAAPGLVESLRNFLTERFPQLFEEDGMLPQGFGALQDRFAAAGASLVNTLLSSTLAVFDFLLLLVVSPVVAFYLLLDWDRMTAKIDSWLPLDHRDTIRRLAMEIDKVLNSFLRGQITVMAFLAVFYSVGLMLIGLQFGAFVGLFAGLISFIPYVGSILGGALAILLALSQFWGEWIWIAAVIAVFFSGQFIEGNILTPILVGDSVGLHPVWLMFALAAFGAMFGFFGLLVAVPVAAMIGVLARFALEQYLHGRLYKGLVGREAESPEE